MKTVKSIMRYKSFLVVTIAIGMFLLSACEKEMEGKIFRVSDELMIDELMETKPELSLFLQIVDISNLRGTIHAYGSYTFFAPTNDGVNEYLSASGKSITGLSEAEAQEIVKYHLIRDTLSTSEFIDGRLATANFSNKYITTRMLDSDDGVVVEVNRQAIIVEKDLHCGNGYVHVVDKVLSHSVKSITDVVNELPDEQYSLMKELFTRSKIAERVLDNPNLGALNFSFFIQDNGVFEDINVSSVDELLVRLREKTPDVTGDEQLIFNYVGYHLANGLNYVADLLMSSTLNTIISNQVISLKREYEQVLLNEFEINGVLEKGALVDRESDYTDLTCSNGVVHKINGNIEIVKRSAYRVYWDLAEQPEIMALKGFRKAGTVATFEPGDLSEISWGGGSYNTLTYYCPGYPLVMTKDNNYVNGDYINFYRLSTTQGTSWAEFTTPLLVEGKYKVWIGMRYINTDTTPQEMRTIFKQQGEDDQLLGTTSIYYGVTPGSYGLTEMNSSFHELAELDGQKVYTASYYESANPCFLLGSIEVTTTGRHTFRWEAVQAKRFAPNLDVIHFIPVDDDQIWPKQDTRGKLIYENTPACEIYPYTDCE